MTFHGQPPSYHIIIQYGTILPKSHLTLSCTISPSLYPMGRAPVTCSTTHYNNNPSTIPRLHPLLSWHSTLDLMILIDLFNSCVFGFSPLLSVTSKICPNQHLSQSPVHTQYTSSQSILVCNQYTPPS